MDRLAIVGWRCRSVYIEYAYITVFHNVPVHCAGGVPLHNVPTLNVSLSCVNYTCPLFVTDEMKKCHPEYHLTKMQNLNFDVSAYKLIKDRFHSSKTDGRFRSSEM